MSNAQANSPAEIYEAYLVPGMHARWTPLFLEQAAPASGDQVIDVACGTGIVARSVAPMIGREGRILGVDVSADMLAVARRSSTCAETRIDWCQADAAALPEDGPFDLALCQQGLQFFTDKPGAAAELRRVTAPGGRAVVSVWQGLDRHPLYRALIEAEARFLDAPVADLATPFSFPDAGALEELLRNAGFSNIEVKARTHPVQFPQPGRFVALTALAAAAIIPETDLDQAARQRMTEQVAREIDDAVQAWVDGDTLVFPMHANIAVAA